MIILTNGYKLPETGDFGDVWFPAIEDNIQRLNDHTHDGTNSEKLPATSISAINQTVLSGSFAVQPSGEFRATVNVPTGGDFDTMNISFRDPSTKDKVYLKYEKISVTQFYVYTNFVQDFEVIFS